MSSETRLPVATPDPSYVTWAYGLTGITLALLIVYIVRRHRAARLAAGDRAGRGTDA